MRAKSNSLPARFKDTILDSRKRKHETNRVVSRSLQGLASFPSFGSAAERDSAAERGASAPQNSTCEFIRILSVYLLVLLTQWMLLSYLSPFFPQFATSLGISDEVTGIIFACYPVGAMITSPVVGLFIQRLGTKLTVCIGLAVAGTFTMLFGLSKDYFGIANPNQQYFFIIFAFIYGMGSTLADTGMLVAVEKMCTASNLARVLAIGEIAVGVGCMVGPAIGGVLVSYGGSNCSATVKGFLPEMPFLVHNGSALSKKKRAKMSANETYVIPEQQHGCWLATFTVMCGSAFLTMLCVIVILPAIRKGKFSEAKSALDARVVSKDKSVDEDQRGNDPIENQSGRSSCKCWKLTLQYQLLVPVFLYFLTQISFSCMSPVLALHLADPETFDMDSSATGLVWLISAFTYMGASLLLGFWVDNLPVGTAKGYAKMLAIASTGSVLTGVGWFLLGPFQLPFVTGVDPFQPLRTSLASLVASQVLIGIGSAAVTIPTMPLMLYWVPENEEDHRALITASYMSVYTAACALGNVLGGLFNNLMGFRNMATMMVAACIMIFVVTLAVIACKILQSRGATEADGLDCNTSQHGSGRSWVDSESGNAPLLANMASVVGESVPYSKHGPPPPLPSTPTPAKANTKTGRQSMSGIGCSPSWSSRPPYEQHQPDLSPQRRPSWSSRPPYEQHQPDLSPQR